MNTATNLHQQPLINRNLEPVLHKVLREAQQEHRKLQEMFTLMGWGDLPDALKIEIKEDVSAMVEELKGQYSSCDPHVARRRRSVIYWINNYEKGISSLETTIEALRVKKL